jgi:hypothetical protein
VPRGSTEFVAAEGDVESRPATLQRGGGFAAGMVGQMATLTIERAGVSLALAIPESGPSGAALTLPLTATTSLARWLSSGPVWRLTSQFAFAILARATLRATRRGTSGPAAVTKSPA